MTCVLSGKLYNDLDIDAKPFIPEYVKEEECYFDNLEKEFMRANKWIFEDEDDTVEKTKDKNVKSNEC